MRIEGARARATDAARGAARGRLGLALREAALLALVLLIFSRVHALVGTDAATATTNALALQDVERFMNLDIELSMNAWLAGHPALILPAVLLYRLYYAVLLGVLVWVFVRHASVYRHVRRTFVVLCALALAVYWVVPMSPPRFALAGSVDIVAEHDLFGGAALHEAGSYSAMPSVHVAWSAWCAYAAWRALRGTHPRAAWAAWAFPAIMVVDVFATANHYVLDVVGSAVLLVASIAMARAWDRLAPPLSPQASG